MEHQFYTKRQNGNNFDCSVPKSYENRNETNDDGTNSETVTQEEDPISKVVILRIKKSSGRRNLDRCGNKGPGSLSQLGVKELVQRSSRLQVVDVDDPFRNEVQNPFVAGDLSKSCGFQFKKEMPEDAGKETIDQFWKLVSRVNTENSDDFSGECASRTRRSCRLRLSQRQPHSRGHTQTVLESGMIEKGRSTEDLNGFDKSMVKEELKEESRLDEVERLESAMKHELQETTDWPLPTSVTGSQRTPRQSSRSGRQGKGFGGATRHERGKGERGRGGKRGRGRRQGKDGGRRDVTKKAAAAGSRNQSNVYDSIKQEMPIDSESEQEVSQVKVGSEKLKIGSKPTNPSKPKTFQCTHCLKYFMTQNNLIQHAKWMHGANRPLSQPSLWFFQSQCNTVAHAVAALTGTALTSDRKLLSDWENPGNSDKTLLYESETQSPKNQRQCQTCQKVFKTSYSLLVHSRMHSGQKLFNCRVCDQKFITRGHLTKHQRTHADRRDKSSTSDAAEAVSSSNIQSVVWTDDHMSVISLSGLALAECVIDASDTLSLTIPNANLPSDAEPLSPINSADDETTVDRKYDASAERTDSGAEAMDSRHTERKHVPVVMTKNQIECEVCGKVFTTKYSLLIHSRIHTGEKPYSCDVCNQRFYTSSHLVTHRRVHTGEKPYKCKDCDKSFSSSNPLRRHQQSFHSTLRPYVCEYCAKTFKFKDNLRLHIARRHSNKKQVKCSVCDLMFTDRKQARRHEQLKHKKKALGYEEISSNGECHYKCSFCDLTFMELKEVKQHSIDVHEVDVDDTQMPVHQYKCNVCGKAYVWRGGLREHMLKHSAERQFECKICNKKFFSREVLRRHSITHTDVRPFTCTICSKRFKSKGVLSKHAIRFHFGEKQYSCEVCGKQFFTATELKTHKAFHTDEKLFVCNICDAHLKTQMSLKRHMISHGERKFSCETCGKQFFTELHLKRHELTHTGEKPFNCYLCGKQFHTKKNLGRHMALHGEKKYSCETCQKKFFTEMDKKIHEALHLGKKPFDCHLCSRSFNAKKTLKRHLCLHDEEKRYSCQFCGRMYSSAAELECHKRIHTGEKPFECPICDEKFRVKVNLKRHLNRHGGEKRHECELCGKKFLLRQYLRQHVRSHAGAKPYTCCTCNKRYVWRRDLMIHYRKCRTGVICVDEMLVNN